MKNRAIKNIIVGFVTGLIATAVGSILWILGFSDYGISETIRLAFKESLIAPILSAGALLNLVAFFGFLKQKKSHHARGVIFATLLVASFVLIQKLT